MQKQAEAFALDIDKAQVGDDIHGLRMLCLYGLKGAAAYMEHAHVLGQYDNEIYRQYHQIMAWLGTLPADMNELLDNAMAIGQMNFKVMEILDAGETGSLVTLCQQRSMFALLLVNVFLFQAMT